MISGRRFWRKGRIEENIEYHLYYFTILVCTFIFIKMLDPASVLITLLVVTHCFQACNPSAYTKRQDFD